MLAGEGSSNYVVFDDDLIEILKKYGLSGVLGRRWCRGPLLTTRNLEGRVRSMAAPDREQRQPSGEAEYLLTHPLLGQILDGQEQRAVEAAVQAAAGDDSTRRTAMFKVQAIRELRRELADLAQPSRPGRMTAVI